MADFDSTSYVQLRDLDNFPAKYHPDLEFFFKIDILLQNFWAKSIPRKMAHPRVPQHSKYPPGQATKKWHVDKDNKGMVTSDSTMK